MLLKEEIMKSFKSLMKRLREIHPDLSEIIYSVKNGSVELVFNNCPWCLEEFGCDTETHKIIKELEKIFNHMT